MSTFLDEKNKMVDEMINKFGVPKIIIGKNKKSMNKFILGLFLGFTIGVIVTRLFFELIVLK